MYSFKARFDFQIPKTKWQVKVLKCTAAYLLSFSTLSRIIRSTTNETTCYTVNNGALARASWFFISCCGRRIVFVRLSSWSINHSCKVYKPERSSWKPKRDLVAPSSQGVFSVRFQKYSPLSAFPWRPLNQMATKGNWT